MGSCMRVKWLTALAWHEIRNNRRFSVFFVLNLALGLSCFLTIQSFKDAIAAGLGARSREMLTADLRVSARRPLRPAELEQVREQLGASARETQAMELYSMVASSATSRLAEVMVIAPGYPFYGTLKLRRAGLVGSDDTKALFRGPLVWLQADLAAQLRTGVGDRVRIGQRHFKVDDIVEQDVGASGRGF